jgi:hypothetical protein
MGQTSLIQLKFIYKNEPCQSHPRPPLHPWRMPFVNRATSSVLSRFFPPLSSPLRNLTAPPLLLGNDVVFSRAQSSCPAPSSASPLGSRVACRHGVGPIPVLTPTLPPSLPPPPSLPLACLPSAVVAPLRLSVPVARGGAGQRDYNSSTCEL